MQGTRSATPAQVRPLPYPHPTANLIAGVDAPQMATVLLYE